MPGPWHTENRLMMEAGHCFKPQSAGLYLQSLDRGFMTRHNLGQEFGGQPLQITKLHCSATAEGSDYVGGQADLNTF